jgi:hypothetical protein
MRHYLIKISLSLIVLCVSLLGLLSFSLPVQALESESQPYFIKQIQKDKVLVVSPNFRGSLSQTSLLPSLTEISEKYHIKATRTVTAEKLNGKLVPGLIVYVEHKPLNNLGGIVATKPQ